MTDQHHSGDSASKETAPPPLPLVPPSPEPVQPSPERVQPSAETAEQTDEPSPWWSGPPQPVRDAREGTATDTATDIATPAVITSSSDWSDPLAETLQVGPGYGSDQGGPPPHDPWATPTDTFGGPVTARQGPRLRVLLALATTIALLAGLAGGGLGYWLSSRNDGGGVVLDGSGLGKAPARSQTRAPNSVAGVAAKVLPSVVQIKVQTSQGEATGSGFVVDSAGIVVTNNHVVADAQGDVVLTFSDGRTTSASVVGTSSSYDLAVLRVQAKNLPALALGNSDSVVVGDTVVAVGSPLGLSGTVTSGIVSAKNRPVTAGSSRTSGRSDGSYISALQTDAAINPGNSGGPLVNLDAEVIGINSAIATLGTTTGGESGNIGVGFAIPINQVRRTVEQLLKTGHAEYPIIGASVDGSYTGQGAKISTGSSGGQPPIVPGGPADNAGLQPGDVILALDGTAVADGSELIVGIRSHQPGDTVTLRVSHNGSERDVAITLSKNSG